jgi:GNAT superfamily N-acetyltransferase
MSAVTIRPIDPGHPDDAGDIATILLGSWGATQVVSRGAIHDATRLPGFVAERAGVIVGLLTYRPDNTAWEIVTVDAIESARGIGTALVSAVAAAAQVAGASRLWLITTNDNLDALRFYQRRGWRICEVHRGAVDVARRLKPIPLVGRYGIEIHDELELELIV